MQPAAQESVTRGKQSQLCPVFYVPPGLPPPSPHLPAAPLPVHTVPGAGQRFHTEVPPKEGHLQESSDSGRSLEQCRNASKEGGRRTYSSPWPPLLCPPSGYSRGGAAPRQPRPALAETRCRCFPFPLTTCVCRAVSSPFLHVPGKREES